MIFFVLFCTSWILNAICQSIQRAHQQLTNRQSQFVLKWKAPYLQELEG